MKKILFLFSLLVFAVSISAQTFKYQPTASATIKGLLSNTDWTTFNNKFTLPALTSGSMVVSDGTTLVQDNANLFWDDTNNRLGIGTNIPTTELHVVSTSSSEPRGFMSSQYSSDALAARMHFRKSRGTMVSPTTIVTGDLLGRLRFSGYDGTSFLQMGSIDIGTYGTIGTNRIPTYLAFSTAKDSAVSVLTEKMRLSGEGGLTLNSNSLASTAILKLTGTWFSGGSATTTKPHLLLEPSGTTSTAWNTNGTGLGVNAASGFSGALFDFQLAGSSIGRLSYVGRLSVSEGFQVTGGFVLNTTADGVVKITNNATTDFNRLMFGGITSSFPSLKRNGTGLECRLADDSAYAPFTCLTLNTASTITSNSSLVASGGNSTINTQGSYSGTSGNNTAFNVLKNFSPTSGTGTFAAFDWTGIINQTGGANGISRGLYINPTVIAAADFRAIEIAVGTINVSKTITAPATTGNQTINKLAGTVNIAAAGTTITVTNSLVTTGSIIMCTVQTNDTTAVLKNVVPAAGSFVINMNAAVTAETAIAFFVIN